MKILLSPAKNLTQNYTETAEVNDNLLFPEITKKIVATLKTKTVEDLKQMMKLSDNLANLNYNRNQELNANNLNTIPAIKAFQGEVYKGLSADTLSAEASGYLDENLFIISGLYGLLRPKDGIQAYRLEMGTKIQVLDKSNLYGVWQEKITQHLQKSLKKDELVLNLASDEYAKAIDFKKLDNQVINVDFLDFSNGKMKKIMVFLKNARGSLARYCADKQIDTLKDLRAAEVNGYRLEESKSNEFHLVFTR